MTDVTDAIANAAWNDSTVPGDSAVNWDSVPTEESSRPLTAAEFISAGPDPTDFINPPDPDVTTAREEYDQPDPSFVKAAPRKPHAVAYQKKVHEVLHFGMMVAFSNENTIPDAAAIIQYGPKLEHAMGDWAADDIRVRKAIDFISGGTATPALAATMAAVPLVLQVMRNHETETQIEKRPLKIWRWTLPIKMRFGIRLPKRFRAMTNDPVTNTKHVLGNAKVRAALADQGITVTIQ